MKYLAPEEVRARRGNLKYLAGLTDLARINRKKMTQGEVLVWNLLKSKRLGFKFLKQKPIGKFVLDFYCPKLLLAIEVDGGYHDRRQGYDQGRDVLLLTRGIETLRLKEEEVLENIFEIRKRIEEVIEERVKVTKNCSPPSRGAPEG